MKYLLTLLVAAWAWNRQDNKQKHNPDQLEPSYEDSSELRTGHHVGFGTLEIGTIFTTGGKYYQKVSQTQAQELYPELVLVDKSVAH